MGLPHHQLIYQAKQRKSQLLVEGLELVEPSDCNPSEEENSQAVETFDLYEKVQLSVAAETAYDQRKGFFSYSSAHQQMAENFKGENNKALEEGCQAQSLEYDTDNPQPAAETSVVLPGTLADDGVDPTSLG